MLKKAHTGEKTYAVKSLCWRKPVLEKTHNGERSHLVGRAYAKNRLHLGLPAEYNMNIHTEHRQGFFLRPTCASSGE